MPLQDALEQVHRDLAASIAVWSPGLNAAGNSLVGTLALERLAAITGWSVF